MNIDLELYKIFYIVAKSGSISAATKILFISQPAITSQIKNLECNDNSFKQSVIKILEDR